MQKEIYDNAYAGKQRIRKILRFDIRYRSRRVQEVLSDLGIEVAGKRVLDVGFGRGDLLASFPPSCHVTGAEISSSAVASAKAFGQFDAYASADFIVLDEDDAESLPKGPFDIILSAHTLEHVPDDGETLEVIKSRLAPGGHLVVFVPVEEPGYNPDHVREYSVSSLASLITSKGLEVRFSEGSMHINGHIWKFITIPSRRRWPILGPLVNTLRLSVLTLIPYSGVRWLDRLLDRLGVGPRQALAIAHRSV